jgi:ribosomal protein L24
MAKFKANDNVKVIAGSFTGKTGFVFSIEKQDIELKYNIKFHGLNSIVPFSESELELVIPKGDSATKKLEIDLANISLEDEPTESLPTTEQILSLIREEQAKYDYVRDKTGRLEQYEDTNESSDAYNRIVEMVEQKWGWDSQNGVDFDYLLKENTKESLVYIANVVIPGFLGVNMSDDYKVEEQKPAEVVNLFNAEEYLIIRDSLEGNKRGLEILIQQQMGGIDFNAKKTFRDYIIKIDSLLSKIQGL